MVNSPETSTNRFCVSSLYLHLTLFVCVFITVFGGYLVCHGLDENFGCCR